MASRRTHTHQLTIALDEDDYRDVMREIKFRQNTQRQTPDGASCEIGKHIAEICRDLAEYRGLSAKVDPNVWSIGGLDIPGVSQ